MPSGISVAFVDAITSSSGVESVSVSSTTSSVASSTIISAGPLARLSAFAIHWN